MLCNISIDEINNHVVIETSFLSSPHFIMEPKGSRWQLLRADDEVKFVMVGTLKECVEYIGKQRGLIDDSCDKYRAS